MSDPADREADVSPSERAHQRRRDRKRETRMVVDNAGIRRVLQAVRRRPAPEPPREEPDSGSSAS